MHLTELRYAKLNLRHQIESLVKTRVINHIKTLIK